MRVIREADHWVALVEGIADFQGGVTGDTIEELHEEVEAVKHFALDVPKGTEVIVGYIDETRILRVDRLVLGQHRYVLGDAAGAGLWPLGVLNPVQDRVPVDAAERLEELPRGVIPR